MASIMMMRCSLLLFAVALAKVATGVQVDQLQAICASDKKAELTGATDLAGLVDVSRSNPNVCSQRIQAAIVELDQLVNSDNDNVCSPAKIDQIRAYYTKFVDKKSLDGQHEAKLPGALRDFFLSYGFGVSRVCKTNMIKSLMSASETLLDENDFNQVKSLTSENSPLIKVIKTPKDVDDLVLPKDIVSVMNQKSGKGAQVVESEPEKVPVVLQSATARSIERIQAVCDRRFKPIYEQLILPLVSLSRVGLNYKGDELSAHLEEMKTNKNVHLWYKIVYLCESLDTVEVFEDSQEASKDDKKTVRVLSAEEAEDLRAQGRTPDAFQDIGAKIDYNLVQDHKLADLIVNKEDKSVRKLVGKFEAHKSETRRVRNKVMRHMFTVIKELLKNDKVNFVKSLMKKGDASSINKQLVKVLDQYASQISPEGEEQHQDGLTTDHNRVKRSPEAKLFTFWGVFAVLALAACFFILFLG